MRTPPTPCRSRCRQEFQRRTAPHVQVVTDAGDTIRAAVENAILHRANPQAVKLDDAARQFRGMTILEMGRSFFEDTWGARLRGLSKRELATVLPAPLKRAGMQSTFDFKNILSNVVNSACAPPMRWRLQSWKKFCRQSNAPIFKERAIVQLSSAPSFKKVKEGGENSYGALTDGVEKYALSTYGRIVAITRQALINDDLSAFDRIPMMLGRQAAELESSHRVGHPHRQSEHGRRRRAVPCHSRQPRRRPAR